MSLIKANKHNEPVSNIFKKMSTLANADPTVLSQAGINVPAGLSNRFIMLLDSSGSMGGNKIRDTVSAAKEVIHQFSTQVSIESVVFGNTNFPNSVGRVPASSPLNLQADGGTPMREALEELLQEPIGTHSLLISDGMPDSGAERILELVSKKIAGKYIVHTLGIGDDCDHDLMRNIAMLTGGTYLKVLDITLLRSAFIQLAKGAVKALTDGSKQLKGASRVITMGDKS